jgi:hypothetical protein
VSTPIPDLGDVVVVEGDGNDDCSGNLYSVVVASELFDITLSNLEILSAFGDRIVVGDVCILLCLYCLMVLIYKYGT